MDDFWNGFEKQAGWIDRLGKTIEKGTTVEHVITGKANPKIPVQLELGDKTLKALGNVGKAGLGLLGGFALGSVLGKGYLPQNPRPSPNS